jgi:hypothetical protein
MSLDLADNVELDSSPKAMVPAAQVLKELERERCTEIEIDETAVTAHTTTSDSRRIRRSLRDLKRTTLQIRTERVEEQQTQ